MQTFYFWNFFKQQLCIFSQKLSNKNKQRLYKIQKCPTSLFYHALLIKQNECNSLQSITVQGQNKVVKLPLKFSLKIIDCHYDIFENMTVSRKKVIFRCLKNSIPCFCCFLLRSNGHWLAVLTYPG